MQYLSVPIACHHRTTLKLHHGLFPLAHKNLNPLQDPGENKVHHFEVQVRPIAVEQADQTHYRRYDATAQASLVREIGRTWGASASYVRNVEYLETYRLPYFYDGVILQFAGLISRRTGFHSSAGATFGDLGIPSDTNPRGRFDTEYANVGMGFAFSRYLSANADYVFYMYSLNQLGAFAPGAEPKLHRHDVVLYISAWAPVFERGRKTNAAR